LNAFLLLSQKARFLQKTGKFVQGFDPLPGKSGFFLSRFFLASSFPRNLPVLGAISRKNHEDFGQVALVLRRPARGGRGGGCGM
jgi:hypothetical protein